MIINFHETIPPSRILVSLSIIDDMILKRNDNDFKKIMDNLHELKENVSYVIGFQRVVKDDVDNV